MKPTLNRILVAPPAAEEDNEQSTGGILIPQMSREQSKFVEGRVLSIGPDVKSINPGDSVLYKRDQANEITQGASVVAVLIEDKHVAVVLKSVAAPVPPKATN